MTEPPRPPGEGEPGATPPEPTSPPTPPASYSMPGEAPSPGYAPPPSDAPPPTGGTDYPPPAGDSYPPPGYPPQGPPGGYYTAGPAPSGYANNDEKTWALVAHFGGAAGAFLGGGTLGWIGPLVALLAKGNQSPTVRAHAITALNFQLLWSIITVICWILVCVLIGAILAPIAMIIAIVFGVIGGVKANDGLLYNYPLSVPIIK